MEKKYIYGIVAVLVLAILFVISISGEGEAPEEVVEEVKEVPAPPAPAPSPPAPTSNQVNYNSYSFQFIEGRIDGILSGMIGGNTKIAFYLPPTGYINVTRGSTYGVPFAVNNVNPSADDYFEYEFSVDPSTLTNCNVDNRKALSWITSGQRSFGRVPEGWIDKMTAYYEFPSDAPICTAKYNFKVTKNYQTYAEQQIVFNILE